MPSIADPARSNNGLTTFQSGNGFHIATTGITTVIFATSYTTAVCRYQEGLGTDTYMGGALPLAQQLAPCSTAQHTMLRRRCLVL